jgi:hypothetical protein
MLPTTRPTHRGMDTVAANKQVGLRPRATPYLGGELAAHPEELRRGS